MNRQKDKRRKQIRRHLRVRKKVSGTPERPRLAVYRSLRHIYAQIIDDLASRTLVSVSTESPELRKELAKTSNRSAAQAVGKRLAEKALVLGIRTVMFDRGGFRYHGRVKALADAAREGGLVF